MTTHRRRVRGTAFAGLASASLLAGAVSAPAFASPPDHARAHEAPGRTVDVQLLAFNDYHGHLAPDAALDRDGVPTRDGNVIDETGTPVPAGGVAYLATHLEQLRAGHENSLTVAAGDLIGGSPFLSGLFHDEPSVESLNALDLDVSSVGNHEFDEGVDELLRMQNGGCHPVDGCYFPDAPYAGADFQWLAANVVNTETGETPLPPYWIKNFKGAKVGFIGMTLEGTPQLVAQAGIRGYEFRDEAETANKVAKTLQEQGVDAIVVLLHEGGEQPGSYNGCDGISGPVVDIQNRLDPAIDMMITGHTHQAYNCVLTDPAGNDRRVTSAYSYGRVISEINFTVDKAAHDVIRDTVTATNHIVTREVTPDATEQEIIAKWSALSDEVANRPVGETSAPITRGDGDRQTESDLGNLIADAQLWATQENGAQIALMNPGGVRADLDAGTVTYGEAFDVQPFGNLLSTMPMTGQQIVDVLEEQCQPADSSRPFLHLGVSEGFTYTLDRTVVDGDCTGVQITDVALNGTPLDPAATYLVTVNNFLADGGDNFGTFAQVDASLREGAGVDLDAFVAYLGKFSPVDPPGTDRVHELF
jgi:5'-nucleotidase